VEDDEEPVLVEAHVLENDLEGGDRRGAAIEHGAEGAHPAPGVLTVVLIAHVGEVAAVEGGGAEEEARELGEDAGPAAGERGRGRGVTERPTGEDGVEGDVI